MRTGAVSILNSILFTGTNCLCKNFSKMANGFMKVISSVRVYGVTKDIIKECVQNVIKQLQKGTNQNPSLCWAAVRKKPFYGTQINYARKHIPQTY